MEHFFTVLAWIFGVASTFLVVLRVLGRLFYTELDMIHDMGRGLVRSFTIVKPLQVAIVCWAWIFTR